MAFATALFVSKRLQLAVGALLCLAAAQLVGAVISQAAEAPPPGAVRVAIALNP
ncbi:MAG: hypothetical protein ABIO39_02945 [Caulobacteraceae bacterium]